MIKRKTHLSKIYHSQFLFTTGTKTFLIKTTKLQKYQGLLQNFNTRWEKHYVLTYISKVAMCTGFQGVLVERTN